MTLGAFSLGFLARTAGFAVALALAGAAPALASSISIGENVGNLEAVLSDGRPIPFDHVPNQVTVLMFGASWCPPCGPLKNQMANELGKQVAAQAPGVRFVYIQVDEAFHPASKTPVQLESHFWPATVDHSKFKSPVQPSNPKFWDGRRWYTSSLPNALVVDSKGVVLAKGWGRELPALTDKAIKASGTR